MRNAVNTWTTAIATPYDYEKHPRKLRIGFFLDDASTVGGVMTKSMAGHAASQTVTTRFEPEYGTKANRYSVAEWAWRVKKVFSFKPADIIEALGLKNPIFSATTNYGHFGKADLPWEKINSERIDMLQKA